MGATVMVFVMTQVRPCQGEEGSSHHLSPKQSISVGKAANQEVGRVSLVWALNYQ